MTFPDRVAAADNGTGKPTPMKIFTDCDRIDLAEGDTVTFRQVDPEASYARADRPGTQ